MPRDQGRRSARSFTNDCDAYEPSDFVMSAILILPRTGGDRGGDCDAVAE